MYRIDPKISADEKSPSIGRHELEHRVNYISNQKYKTFFQENRHFVRPKGQRNAKSKLSQRRIF